MVIIVSVLVVCTLLAIIYAVGHTARRMYRAATTTAPSHRRLRLPPDDSRIPQVPSFGGLPDLGPIGALGQLAPDADISSTATNEHDLYGE